MAGEIEAVGDFVAAMAKAGITPGQLRMTAGDEEAMNEITQLIKAQAVVVRKRRQSESVHSGLKQTHISSLPAKTGMPYGRMRVVVDTLKPHGITRVRHLLMHNSQELIGLGLSKRDVAYIDEVLSRLGAARKN